MRVDDRGFYSKITENLNRSESRLRKIQDQITSGQKLLRPSDDPLAFSQAIDLDATRQRLQDARERLTQDSLRMDHYDALLGELSELVQGARDLTLRASNDPSSGPDSRQALAQEVDSLLQQALLSANRQRDGQYMLSGSQTATQPFQANLSGGRVTSVDYQGDLRFQPIKLPDGQSLKVELHGEAVASGGGSDLFGTLIALRDGLEQSGTDYQGMLDRLDNVQQNLLERRVEAGGASRFTAGLAEAAQKQEIQLDERLHEVAGLDIAQASVSLVTAERDFQISMSVVGRTSSLSLIDYLR